MTAQAPTSLPAPRLAEAYEVIEVVRQGGLSTTLRARHRGSGEMRCIDVLRPAPGAIESLDRRLDAEARPLMELRHPHVARLVDAAVGTAGEACLVREDQDGVTLRRLTGERRPSVSLAVEILRQAADALTYLHSRGRRVAGLAPEGMLLGADASGRPRLLLADLGLAKDWQEEAALTAAGLFVGRLRYTAPEQFEAGDRQQAPADVYALGLVAYELLTGCHPVSGDSASSLIAGHLFRPPRDFAETDPEGEVPEPLRRLVMSALAKSPEDRPDAAGLASDLEVLQTDLPVLDFEELLRWIDLHPGRSAVPDEPVETSASTALESAGTRKLPPDLGGTGGPADEETLQDRLDEARALARDEKFVEARDVVRQVLRAKPDHSDGLMLLASVEACLKIQVEESRSHQTAVSPVTADEVSVDEAADDSADDATTEPSPAETSRFRTVGSPAVSAADDMRTMRIDPHRIAPPAVSEMATTVSMDARPDGGGSPPPAPDGMRTLRIDPSAIAPPAGSGAGSQEPGAPGSTERLDLPEGGADRGETKPLTAEVLDQVSSSDRATIDPVPEVEATLRLDPSPDVPVPDGPASSDTVPEAPLRPAEPDSAPLPGTVTMPMEQVRDAKRRSAGSASAESPADPPAAPPTAPAPTPPPPTSFASSPAADDGPGEPATPVAASRDGSSSGCQAPQSPASAGELGFGGAAPPSFADRRGRRGRKPARSTSRKASRRGDPSRRRKGSVGILVGASVAAVVVFAIGYAIAAGVDLGALVSLGDASEVIVPPSELPPVAADPGWLVLDAAPWAEIVQISDALGENVQLRIRHTPARYQLPPGAYTVVLAAEGGEPQSFELEVTAGEATEIRADLRSLDADDYFRLMGWP